MKFSVTNFDRNLAFSRQSKVFRLSKRASTHRETTFKMQSLSPIISDPFREIDQGSPNNKIQPILLKARLSPNPTINERISIRLPEITNDGRLKLNFHFLPSIMSTRVKKCNSPEARPEGLARYKSESSLLNTKRQISELKCYQSKSEPLEVSFGKNSPYSNLFLIIRINYLIQSVLQISSLIYLDNSVK